MYHYNRYTPAKMRTEQLEIGNMATISKDKNSIRIHFTDPLTGRKRFLYPKLKWNASDLKKAEGILRILEGDIADGTFDPSLSKYKYKNQLKLREESNTPLSWLYGKYLSIMDIHPRTYRQKEYVIRNFIDECGDKPPNRYDYNDIDLFLSKQLEKYPKSFNRKSNLLYDMFNYFWGCSLVDCNIVKIYLDKAYIKKNNNQKNRIKIFADEEINKILAKCQEYYPEWLNFVNFLFNTGCRLGEAVALQWQDVNFKTSEVTFNNTYDNEFGFNQAKAGNRRTIELDNNTHNLLYWHYYSDTPVNQFVFKYHGKAINTHYFRNKVWKDILYQSKITYRKPYTIRHTFITNLLKKGIDPITISTVTGHTPNTLMKEYAHVLHKISLKDLKP